MFQVIKAPRAVAWTGVGVSLVFVIIAGILNRSATASERPSPRWEEVFRVPDTDDVKELITSLSAMDAFEPRTDKEWAAFREQGVPAMKKVSQKILRLTENRKKSDDYQTAKYTLLAIRVFEVTEASEAERDATIEIVKKLLSGKQITDDDLDLAVALCSNLEVVRDSKVAEQAYQQLGHILEKKKEPGIQQLGKRFLGSARRIGLVGNEMEISGTTLDGKEFEWSEYRGKVVLVDFWATWCSVCVQEMPRLRELYTEYHPQGFEVVGISGDRDTKKLAAYVKSQSLPWVNLHSGGDRPNPTVEYYGIYAYPTTILIDRDGKVVTMEARGKTLEHWLAKLLGDPQVPSGPKTAGDRVLSERKAERSAGSYPVR